MPRLNARLRRRQLDQLLAKNKEFPIFSKGYIHEIRNALEMSSSQLARLLNVSQSTIRDLERSELKGTISLNSLKRVAKALGCRLNYALVPETTLRETIEARERKLAEHDALQTIRAMKLERQSTEIHEQAATLADAVDDLMRSGRRHLWDQID